MLKSVIFDMDGVLVDSHPVHERAWRRLMESLGRTVTDQDLEFVLDGHKREDILRFFLGELSPAELKRYGLQKDSLFTEYAGEMQLIAGVREFLASLAEAGLRLAVASSASRVRAERILQQFDLAKYFAAVVTGDDVVCGKPDPACYQSACRMLGGEPAAALVVEDAVSGIKGARAAGMQCLGVAPNGRAERLYEAGASHVVQDFVGLQAQAVIELFGRATDFGRRQPAPLATIPLTVRR
jgi:HAD superfamily hydrolase (TIGR01509 family)